MRIIRAKDIISRRRGDFGATVTAKSILLPRNVATALGRLHVQNESDLLSYTQSFPTAVATALKWEVEDVGRARERLMAAIEDSAAGYSRGCRVPTMPGRKYGARHPKRSMIGRLA